MNVKQITRALHTLSLLSEEDYDLVLKLRALTEDERGMLTLVLEPSKPAGKKAGKKASKKVSVKSETERVFKRCETCGLTKRADVHKDSELSGYHEFREKKSEHAASLNTQLNKRREQGRGAAESSSRDLCSHVFTEDGNRICDEVYESAVHHDTVYVTYHPFVSAAPPAPASSPANGGVGSTTASSGTQPEDAGSVAHGASEGS